LGAARERAVGRLQVVVAGQDLRHAHRVALRALVDILELLQGQLCWRRGHRRILHAQDAPHGITRQAQQSADLAQRAALIPQRPDAVADLDRLHDPTS